MYSSRLAPALPLLASLIGSTVAQTWTACNPLNRTDCPLDTALGNKNYSINFETQQMSTTVWNATNGVVDYGDNGAEFTINKRFDSPTVQTNFYIFFGQVEVIMRAATGQGIISSIVLESDDLDEVDWEFMGGNNTHVETNYFGKGNNTVFDRAIYYPVETPQDIWHNYTTNWSAEKLEWYIDSVLVRTLLYEDAVSGKNYPQTPMNLRLGIWAGGDPSLSNGTIEWAGGLTDFSKAPFTMYVKSVRVSDASNGTQYKYGDESGSWESIQVLNTKKAVSLDGNNSVSTTQKVKNEWNSFSHTTKIAIIAGGGAGLALLSGLILFCCIRQRRAGRRERQLEHQRYEKTTAELLAQRNEMGRMQSDRLATGYGQGGGADMGMGHQDLHNGYEMTDGPGRVGAQHAYSDDSPGTYHNGYGNAQYQRY